MASPIRITIGIQARSTSVRLPGKIYADILGLSLIDHVIASCKEAADLVNLWSRHQNILCHVALCVPKDDPLVGLYEKKMDLIQGSEFDVLGRYKALSDRFDSKWMVRITSDCGLIPSYVITKCVNTAVKNQSDYISNVDEKCRTAPDGYDCEVISSRLLDYTDRNAELIGDREHVTTFIRRAIWDDRMPAWASYGVILGHYDHSDIKISVNTKEDLERVTEQRKRVDDKLEIARKAYGKRIFRL